MRKMSGALIRHNEDFLELQYQVTKALVFVHVAFYIIALSQGLKLLVVQTLVIIQRKHAVKISHLSC